MFCLFFIQFGFAGSHTEHQWSCTQSILELTASTTGRKTSKPSTSQNDHNEGWGLDEKQELIPCIVQSQVERIDIFSKCKKYLQISAICEIREEYDTCVALETYVHVRWRNVGTLTTWTYIHKYWKLTTINKRELSYNTKAGTSAPIPACCCPQDRWTWIVKRTLFCIYSILPPPWLVCRNWPLSKREEESLSTLRGPQPRRCRVCETTVQRTTPPPTATPASMAGLAATWTGKQIDRPPNWALRNGDRS
jgi:hypothetical protein